MPDLKAQFFTGNKEIPVTWCNNLSTPSIGLGLRDTLTKLGWRGESIATVCLTLTPDGSRLANGFFGLWGTLSADPIEFPASKLWDGTQRGSSIRITNLQGQLFKFASGHLQSDYLDHDKFEMEVIRGNQISPPPRVAQPRHREHGAQSLRTP